MKKLLFLGVDTSTHDAVSIARELGLYTIITDYNEATEGSEKLRSDEYWTIDVADTDAIYERCRKEKIDGIFAGTNEFCLDRVKELCERLGLPFYASDKGWHCARDKVYFKELCEKCGLDIPRTYMTEGSLDGIDKEQITFPVMVKPSDSTARQGMSICHTVEELDAAYEYALSVSQNKHIIIEEYVVGDEVGVTIMAVDGKCYMNHMCTVLTQNATGKGLMTGVMMESKYHDDFFDKCRDKIAKLMELMDWKNGACYLQALVRDGKYYFIEFGGRMPAIGFWAAEEYYFNKSELRMQLMYAAGFKLNADDAALLGSRNYYSMLYMPYLRQGTIKSISGVDEISRIEGVEIILDRCKAGDVIQGSGSMFDIACYMMIAADDKAGLIDSFNKVNDTLSFISTDDEDMLMRYTDTDKIMQELR